MCGEAVGVAGVAVLAAARRVALAATLRAVDAARARARRRAAPSVGTPLHVTPSVI